MAGERRESDFMNKSLDEIAAEMDSSLYDREDRDGHHRPQHRYSPYPAEHVPSWRAEKDGNGVGAGSSGNGGDSNKIFVANLNYTVTWQQLKDLMKTAGPVIKCDLFKNVDGSSRGMGLVVFADKEGADKAICELNGTELDDRKIFLRKDMRVEDREKAGISSTNPKPRPPPNPSATIFVANLDYSLTWQKLRDIFKVAGKIVHVDMLVDIDGRPKGYASIQFETTADAMNAIILFHGQLLQNRPMVVRMDSKSSFQPDPIQLKLQIGKGGVVNSGVRSGTSGGAGILSSLPAPLARTTGGLAGPISPTLGSLSQALNTSAISPSLLTNQLSLLAALGLSTLSNVHHFSPDQLSLLGISPTHLPGGGGLANAKMSGTHTGLTTSSSSHSNLAGQRGMLPSVPEHRQEGLLSNLPFFHSSSIIGDKDMTSSSFGGVLAPHPPPPTSSTRYNATMATNLSLATALAAPNHPHSLGHSRQESDVGRKGKRLFVRNLSFVTSWQTLKDHLKAGTGPINYVDVLKNPDGRSRGSASVVFENEDHAEKAIRMYDQSELDGRRISVTYDRSN